MTNGLDETQKMLDGIVKMLQANPLQQDAI
jgi:hypothetical protein